jgi:hypothetical protein
MDFYGTAKNLVNTANALNEQLINQIAKALEEAAKDGPPEEPAHVVTPAEAATIQPRKGFEPKPEVEVIEPEKKHKVKRKK